MLAIVHSHYSLRAGVRSPKEWAAAAAARGYAALAVADLDGLHGAVQAWRAVEAVGLRPLLGVQLSLSATESCLVLATSAAGYRQLCRLLSRRCLAGSAGLAEVAATATAVDELLFLLRPGLAAAALAQVLPTSNIYRLPELDGQASLWQRLPQRLPLAQLPDAWLIDAADRETLADLARLRAMGGRRPASGPPPQAELLLPDRRAWERRYPQAAQVAAEIVERCQFRFDFNQLHLPRIRLPSDVAPAAHLRELCLAALPGAYPPASRPAARRRLEHELAAICHCGFADYFLYVNEIVEFARKQSIPVEVRGSAAASIVAYLLGFTHCCPLEDDLYFERFLNPGRRDCPDIDLDIADHRRDEVVNFCYERWGEEHVAMVATVQTYGPRGAWRDAVRSWRGADRRPGEAGEPEAAAASPGRVAATAARLLGRPRHLGTHCGGLIITPFPLTDLAPLFRTAKGLVAIHYEKEQAAALGLVKMDLLGNSGLSVIDEARRRLAERGVAFGEPGPAHDFKVDRLFANGDTLGVYQCESPGMRQLCRAIQPGRRREVAAALSLIRPGPAAAGMKETFIRRRRGLEPTTYLHPAMAEFLADTHGVMLYQEDVMRTAVKLAGYSLAEADDLRRATKGHGGEIFQRERQRFVADKAPLAGLEPAVAGALWEQLSAFAAYSFCKAHAAVYGRLAWLTARLKAHHPREFYAAILNRHQSMYPPRVFVWDAIRHGVPIWPPEVTRSEVDWRPVRQGVLAGLGIVRGLRQRLLWQLVAERRRRPFADFADLRARLPFQGDELARLVLVGACSAFGERSELLAQLGEPDHGGRQLPLFAAGAVRPANGRPATPLPGLAAAQWRLTGIPFAGHPAQVLGGDLCPAVELPGRVGRQVSMFGILDAFKTTQASPADGQAADRPMSFATLEDATGLFELVLFPDIHARLAETFSAPGPYLVRGTVHAQWGSPTVALEEVTRCA